MANLTRWDPVHEMWNMRTAMGRYLEAALLPSGSRLVPTSWDLAMDVVETDDE